MAVYTVKNREGKTIKFQWNKETPPTQDDMRRVFEAAGQQTQEQPIRRREPSRLVQGILNLPGSLYRDVAKPMYEAVTHPVRTVDVLTDVLAGGVIKALPESAKRPEYRGVETRPEQVAGALGEELKKTYGGIEPIKETLTERPAVPMMDIAGILGLGGAVAGRTSRAGQILTRAGQAIDPVVLTAKGVGTAAKGASKVAGGMARHGFGITTGKGPANVEVASRGGRAFAKELRGTTPGSEIVSNVNEALNVFKGQRSAQYRERLAQFKNAAVEADMAAINKTLMDKLDTFGYTLDDTGQLQKIGRTKLNPDDVSELGKVIDSINEFNDPKYGPVTTMDLDLLKQRLDDLYTPSSRVRALVTDIRGQVKNEIVSKVPEYGKMTGDYERMTGLIKQMEQALSMGDKKPIDTALKKLTATMREEPEFRRSLIQKLDEMTGVNLEEQIAGYAMRDIVPAGLWAKGIGSVWVAKLFSTLDPTFGALLASASPRVVGEFAHALGLGRKAGKAVGRGVGTAARETGVTTMPVRQTAFQAGRAAQAQPEEESIDTKLRRIVGLGPRR